MKTLRLDATSYSPGDSSGGPSKLEIITDPFILQELSQDAGGITGNGAKGLLIPESWKQLGHWLKNNPRIPVLIQGALTSLTGGATPDDDILVSTKKWQSQSYNSETQLLYVEAGVVLADIQKELQNFNRFYPPAPTYDGATIGGNLATNAAGAATYRYGTTRDWVEGAGLLFRNGIMLELKRGQCFVSPGDKIEIGSLSFTIPDYSYPPLKKISAGYYVTKDMDLLDLFIGQEGTLCFITHAWLKTALQVPSLLFKSEFSQESESLSFCDELKTLMNTLPGFDLRSVEFFDGRCLSLIGHQRPGISAVLLYEIETQESISDRALEKILELQSRYGVEETTEVADSSEKTKQKKLLEIREEIPMKVSEWLRTKNRLDPAVTKMAGDMIVPSENFSEIMKAYREVFDREKLDYLIYGHISDGNVHPNILAKDGQEMQKAKTGFLELAERCKVLKGAPLSEHGVGKHPLKKKMLEQFWGKDVIEQMKLLKLSLDPDGALGRGLLF